MAETDYTTAQADAISGTTDTDVDQAYPTIGESTYYTTVYKLLARLLVLAKACAGNALRVCQDGDLTVEVRPGKIQLGGQAYDHAGVTAEALTNNQTNYVFLTPADVVAGNSVTVNTTGFPATPHIPLATVVTSGGTYDYTNITDYRGRGQWVMPGIARLIVEENTAGVGSPNVLGAGETGLVLSNEGSAAINYHTLPTAAAGLTFTFVRADASHDIRITAAAGDKIVVGAVATKAAGYIESTARWDSVILIALDEEHWFAIGFQGTWTVESS